MKPLGGGEWKFSPSLILTLNTRFPAEVDCSDLFLVGFFCVILGIFLFPFDRVAHQLRRDPHTGCVPSASSGSELWAQSREGEAEGGALSSLFQSWYPPLRNFLLKRAGIHVGCGLLSLTLWGDSGQLIIKGGVWNAGEKYHIDWVNSLGVNVGWRIFEVLCGHFSSSHILQKLKCVSGNIHSCLDPLHPRCGQYEKLSMSFEKDFSKEKNCGQKL